MGDIKQKYVIKVYRIGWITYAWEVHNKSWQTRLPQVHGVALTKCGARRAGEKWVYGQTPVLVMEVD